MRNNFTHSILTRVLGFALICSSAFSYAGAQCPLTPKPVSSEDEAATVVEQAVQVYKLTSLAIDCISFETSSHSTKLGYAVNVREKHSAQCGGDPMTAPRLFTVRVRPNGVLTTDANRIDGILKPLICPKGPKKNKANY